MEDDSSLRVTVMSGLCCSILSPLGPNQSMCLATPATESAQNNNNVMNRVWKIYASAVFPETQMKIVYAPTRTDAFRSKFNISQYQTGGNRFSVSHLKRCVKYTNHRRRPDLTFTHEEFGLAEADLSMSRSDLDFQ